MRRLAALTTSALALAGACSLAAPVSAAEPVDCSNLPTTADARILNVVKGRPASLRAPASYFPGCDEIGDPIELSVDWGDGTPPGPARLEPGDGNRFTVVASHRYQRAGSFQIVITQRNLRTGVSREDRHYFARVRLVRRSLGPRLEWPTGLPFAGRLASVHRRGDAAAGYTARIAWGDGVTTKGLLVKKGARFLVSGRHTWRKPVEGKMLTVVIENPISGRRFEIRRRLDVG